MDYETIVYEKKEKIAYVIFNRPDKLNAINETLILEINQAIDEIERDQHVGVVIITGNGKAFMAGADFQWLEDGVQSPYLFYVQHDKLMRFLLRLERLPKPVIAAINGYALGGGLEIATGCDIRIASEDAILGTPEVTLGIMPGIGATARLPQLVGKGRALEIELTGKPIDAQEAYRIGLVNRVVPKGKALEAAEELANQILKGAPAAMAQIKNAIQVGIDMSTEGASEYCQKCAMLTAATQDVKEGIRAFREKRSPAWKGM